MKVAIAILLVGLFQISSADISGSNIVKHLTIGEANLSANADNNQASATIAQSTALNNGGNSFTNQDLGALADITGDNYLGSANVQAGNIGANANSNSAQANIAQTAAGNSVQNTMLNELNGWGQQTGNSHTQLTQAKIANINANVAHAAGSNGVTQNNVGNSGANAFKNVAA